MNTVQDWLRNESLYTTSAMFIVGSEFGMEFVNWDPITLSMDIKEQFGVEPSMSLMDKLQAGSTLLATDLFHVSLESFSAICNTLDTGDFSSDLMVPPDLDTCMWGLAEARLIEGEEIPFSHNIARYVGFLLANSGMYRPPSLLAFAEYPENEERRTVSNIDVDPEIAKAFWDSQQQDQDDAELYVKTRIRLLMRQIQAIPIKAADQEALTRSLGMVEKSLEPLNAQEPLV